jgi:hypothetical protein
MSSFFHRTTLTLTLSLFGGPSVFADTGLCPMPTEGVFETAIDVRVRPGESLHHFAQWANTTVEQIADFNEMDVTDPTYPGMALMLPMGEDQRAQLETIRNTDVEQRLARYLDRKGGLAGIAAHKVRTGETGWDIAKTKASVPMWVLAAFNTNKNLSHLSVGDTLYLPILGTTLSTQFDAAAAEITGADDESIGWE